MKIIIPQLNLFVDCIVSTIPWASTRARQGAAIVMAHAPLIQSSSKEGNFNAFSEEDRFYSIRRRKCKSTPMPPEKI
jgi:hypothetical protein